MQATHSQSRLSTLRLLQLAAGVSTAFMLDNTARAFTVTDCSDSLASTSTLRYAVAHAASGETIDVTTCSNSVITLSHGEIASSKDVIDIRNNGATAVLITASNTSRIFDHTGAQRISLHNLWVKYGSVTGPSAKGGCIYSTGRVDLYDSRVAHCTVTETAASGLALGGGIYSKGGVRLISGTVASNSAVQQSSSHYKAFGGGIHSTSLASYNGLIYSNTVSNSAGGALNAYTSGGGAFITGGATLYGTAVYNNQAGTDAGLALSTGGNSNAVISNSTIVNNTAAKALGGVWAGGTLTLANSTVAFNQSAESPAGVYSEGVLNLQSSIVAKNTFGVSTASDIYIGLLAGSFDPTSANNIVIAANMALPAGTIVADPRLLPLADNGGPTKTMAFDAESPALDRGNNNFGISLINGPPTCDQRGNPSKPMNNPPNTGSCNAVAGGFLRADALNNKPDIGAYEEQRPNDWIFYDGLEYPPPQ